MKTRFWGPMAAGMMWGAAVWPAMATTHYVDANATNPVAPYTSWATAATNINDAIHAANAMDIVLVTNGVYQTGGNQFPLSSNRVYVAQNIMVQSVNGPLVTIIKGYQMPGVTNGSSAVRCAYLEIGSTLSGFTLTNGATASGGRGGGIFCNGGAGTIVVTNCIVTGNSANSDGGGAYQGDFYSCVFTGNSSYGNFGGGGAYAAGLNNCLLLNNVATFSGGGSYSCTSKNCTFAGNYAGTSGGGAYGSFLNNCILYYNTIGSATTSGTNVYNASVNYSCADATNGVSGTNNITRAPGFVDLANGNYRLQIGSPCINAGVNAAAPSGSDLDGNPRIVGGVVDMGCYENQNTNAVHYVMLSNTAPVAPFTNWVTAATNIQDAVNAASAGDFVVVSNGVYNYGANYVYLAMPNRVAVEQPMTIISVNGPAATIIQGATIPLQMRCIYLTNGATLSGFTLTNGDTMASGDVVHEESGGGVWCEASGAVVSNCVITGNSATRFGGGAFQGTLLNCTITNNQSSAGGGACSNLAINCVFTHNKASTQNYNYGGGAYGGWLSNCLIVANQSIAGSGYGGGAAFCTLTACVVSNNTAGASGGGVCLSIANNSLISSNRASGFGGGAYSNVLNNCALKNNFASNTGGGAYNSVLVNCTVVSNSIGGIAGGGVSGGGVTNSIVYYNNGGNIFNTKMLRNNCAAIYAGDFGITNDPAFVSLAGGDFHLQSNSPCINSGNNAAVMTATDLDGNPRISGGTVDMGAYELQSPASVLSYAWAQQYGLPTDGTVDNADLDGTGFTVAQDWIAGLNPTNPASVLAMESPTPTNNASGITVTWQSVSGIIYFVQRGSDLSAQPIFTTIASNITGQAGTTSYTDATATNSIPYFYRVGVQ